MILASPDLKKKSKFQKLANKDKVQPLLYRFMKWMNITLRNFPAPVLLFKCLCKKIYDGDVKRWVRVM